MVSFGTPKKSRGRGVVSFGTSKNLRCNFFHVTEEVEEGDRLSFLGHHVTGASVVQTIQIDDILSHLQVAS